MTNSIAYRLFVYIGFVLLLPLLLWSLLPISAYSTFTAPSQLLSYIPGLTGVLLRRVWYKLKLRSCGSNLTVDWLAVIRLPECEIGNHVTIGVANWISLCTISDDVIIGNNVSILSGRSQHAFHDTSQPMRLQEGMKKRVYIESDVWIGANAIVMADIPRGSVVGAGSVVTRTFCPYDIIVGVPAKPIKNRLKCL